MLTKGRMAEREPFHRSRYADYSSTAATYDENRAPVGVDIILQVLRKGAIRSGELRLLDAGCGTGSYLVALRGHVGELEGLDSSSAMLARARQKLAKAQNVMVHAGSVLAMPFGDGRFDAVIFNQVLHHLDDEGAGCGAYPNLRRALAESHRVLGPGGALVINTCTEEQIRDGSWYAALIPNAVERMVRRYASVDRLCALLTELHFDVREMSVPSDATFGGPRWLDPTGPFEQSWRNGDSLWSLATDAELEAALAELRVMQEAGTVSAFIREREQVRQSIGQAVFIHARRR
jgi:ubiquinone/menaquinone biosynthesis C-methylase UbiE